MRRAYTRKTLAALLLSAVCGSFSTPASAKVVLFNGVLGVQAASPACGILPYVEQSALYRTTYRPAGVGDNGLSTALILMPTAAALNDLFISSFTLPNASLNVIWSPVDVTLISSNSRLVLNSKQYSAQIRMVQQTPASPDGATFLDMKLQIHGFGGVATCTVTLHGFVGVGDSLTAG